MPKNMNGCIVISVGSNNNWDFEKDVVKKYGCTIHTLDCTIDGKVPADIKHKTTLYLNYKIKTNIYYNLLCHQTRIKWFV